MQDATFITKHEIIKQQTVPWEVSCGNVQGTSLIIIQIRIIQ